MNVVPVRRFRFGIEAQAGEQMCREFAQPRTVRVFERSAEPCDLLVEIRDDPQQETAPAVEWSPGRAVIEGPASLHGKLTATAVEFAFLESELRRLENDLLPIEASAPADVALAYHVRGADSAHWPRILKTMQSIAQMRLTLARFPEPEAGKAMKRLLADSRFEERLESFDSRLEACEDLYEGAVDRIADFRWYRHGEILEIAILAVLALEFLATLLGALRQVH